MIRTPTEASTYPGDPGKIWEFCEPTRRGSTQGSPPTPLRTSNSARRSLTIRLGRTSMSCGFCVPRARLSTSTRSPPTASVRTLRSGVEATTRTLLAAPASAATIAAAAIAPKITEITRRMLVSLLAEGRVRGSPSKRMGGVGTQDEGALEQDLVDALGARRPAEVGGGHRVEMRVLVGQPEAQEVRGLEGEIGFDRPLAPREVEVFGIVIADAAQPALEGLDLGVHVETGRRRLLCARRGDFLAGGGIEGRARHLVEAPGLEPLARHREEGMAPSLRGELVLGVEVENRVRQTLTGRPRCHRSAELQRPVVSEVDERPEAPREERIAKARRAEGDLVVAVEDAEDAFQVDGKVGHPR